ncbi:hypothetical protein ACTQX0_00180 [Lactobacillus amylovorus]|uniref:hypothetical protein n=1 Tax=Lactobacillus amylovorus TaxID=1604 RepID=UPI003F94552F
MYNELVKNNFIDKNGNPTKWALENGLVSQAFTYPNGISQNDIQANLDDMDFQEVLKRMPKDSFQTNPDDKEDVLIDAHNLVRGIKQALQENAISMANREKYKRVLKQMEAQL